MKHFSAEGCLYRSAGVLKYSRARRTVLIGMGFFEMVFLGVLVYFLKDSEAGSVLYIVAGAMVLSFTFSMVVVARTLGSGITVDGSTGEVKFRNASSMGFGTTTLQISEINEMVLGSCSFNQGRNTGYRVSFHTSRGTLVPVLFSFTDLETAREATAELASLISVPLQENL